MELRLVKLRLKVYKLQSILADHSSKIQDSLLSPMSSFVTLMYFCDLFQFYEKIIFLFCQMCFIDKVDTPFSRIDGKIMQFCKGDTN